MVAPSRHLETLTALSRRPRHPWSLIAVLLVAAVAACARTTPSEAPASRPPATAPWSPPPSLPAPPAGLEAAAPRPCMPAPAFVEAAIANSGSLRTLVFSPFRRPEAGWEIYAPLIAREIGTTCEPAGSGFAADLARWQAGHGLPADGRMSPETFEVFKGVWQERRPFVMLTKDGACPDHPDQLGLAIPSRPESYGDKLIQVRRGALDALRRMAADARAQSAQIAADPLAFDIFSGYRSPEADDFRCQTEGNCQGVTRARCSAHRTGLAMDIYVGAAPGFGPDSSADENRLAMSRNPTYRWLVANAARYGFVNYAFEPWHWEWTGESP
jgi:zinc D-Ala-D-Ala carboxypeptidase